MFSGDSPALEVRIAALEAWRDGLAVASGSNALPGEAVELVLNMHTDGATWDAVATALNRQGYRTARGKEWTGDSIRRLRRSGV